MRKAMIAVVVVFLVGGAFYATAFKQVGSMVSAISETGPHLRAPFYERAEEAIDRNLRRQGFVPAPPPQWVAYDPVASSSDWYRGSFNDSLDFYVEVRRAGKADATQTGESLQVYVHWDIRALRWTVAGHEAKFREFRQHLTEWWLREKNALAEAPL